MATEVRGLHLSLVGPSSRSGGRAPAENHVWCFTAGHGLVTAQLDRAHRDPFDRMLAAQAIVENAVLVTADRALAELGGLRVAWG
ncbi:PIN domain-containing protein [Subtercola boreus]|uniref:PIN domain-containing protein n=1 Tax=Subtercola boreus TaxID=120213 RepID=UPI0034617185